MDEPTIMSNPVWKGHAHVYGDDIDTDRIIAGKYTKTLNLDDLAAHVLEDLDPSFRERFVCGDIVVAGWNFGCGSSREQAPLALKTVGVSAVVAFSFARIFYRNAINVGLPVFEIKDHGIINGDLLSLTPNSGVCENHSQSKVLKSHPLPNIMLNIIKAGGLVAWMKEHKSFPETSL